MMIDQNKQNIIKNTIDENLKCKQLIAEKDKSHLMFGVRGAGKSTLIHYLLQNPSLVSKKLRGSLIYQSEESSSKFGSVLISAKPKSLTKHPHSITVNNLTFTDLPGFLDNREYQNQLENQQLINAFSIQQTFNKTKQFKLILAIGWSDYCSERGINFSVRIKQFLQMFPNFNEIKDSTILIITKARSTVQLSDVQESLKQHITDTTFDYNYKNFLNYILEKKRVCIFYEPTNIGKANFDNSNKIMTKISKQLKWCKINDVKVPLSDRAKVKFLQLYELYGQPTQINLQIQKNIHCMIQLEVKSLFNKRKFIQLQFRLLDIYGFISNCSKEQKLRYLFQFFRKSLQSQLALKCLNQLQKKISFLDNLNKIMKFKRHQLYQLQQILENLIELKIFNVTKQHNFIIKNCHQINLVNKKRQNSLRLSFSTQRQIITSKQIQSIINSYPQIIDEFIFTSEKIQIQNDINAYGKGLRLFTKTLILPQKKKVKINLKGKDGSDYQNSSINQDGLPGRNGQNGGSFYLNYKEIIGAGLQIDLRGGNGGKGQNCKISSEKMRQIMKDKDMYNNFKKNNKEKIFLINREKYGFAQKSGINKVTHVAKQLLTFNGQVLQTYSTISMKAWQYCYKYRPGGGGFSGHSGTIFINNNNMQSNLANINMFKIIKQRQKNGKNGVLILQQYQGKYIRQLMFCGLRQQGAQIIFGQNNHFIEAEMGIRAVGARLLTQQIAKQVAEQATIQTSKVVSKQVGKQVGTQATTSTTITTCLSGAFGIGVSLLAQTAISAVSAALSDQWKQKIKFKKWTQMNVQCIYGSQDM